MPRQPTLPPPEVLRAALEAAGLDPDYWSFDDIDEMARRGYSVETMVRLALEREAGTTRRTA